MNNHAGRAHTASRVILATPRMLFRAFVDAETMAGWRAPEGMSVAIRAFDPRVGGGYRMVLTSADPTGAPGKPAPDRDEVEVRFAELLPEEQITEIVTFATDDAAFFGEMILVTTFTPVADGTKVTITARDVPSGIGKAAHEAGMADSLRNLARLTE